MFSFLDIHTRVELLGHMIVLFLVFFQKTPYCFPQWLDQFTFPPTVCTGCLFITSLPTFVICGFLKKINLFIFILFLAALGLCCCAQAFSSCGERELLFVVVRGLLIAVASVVAEHGL